MLADDYTFRAPFRGFGQASYLEPIPGETSSGSGSSGSWWDAVGGALTQVVQAGGKVAAASISRAGGVSLTPYPPKPPAQAGIAGISGNTLLLVGGLGLAAVVILPRLMRGGRRR